MELYSVVFAVLCCCFVWLRCVVLSCAAFSCTAYNFATTEAYLGRVIPHCVLLCRRRAFGVHPSVATP